MTVLHVLKIFFSFECFFNVPRAKWRCDTKKTVDRLLLRSFLFSEKQRGFRFGSLYLKFCRNTISDFSRDFYMPLVPGSKWEEANVKPTSVHDMITVNSSRLLCFYLQVGSIKNLSIPKDATIDFQAQSVFQDRMTCFESKEISCSHCLRQIEGLKCMDLYDFETWQKRIEAICWIVYYTAWRMHSRFETWRKFEKGKCPAQLAQKLS